MSKCCDCMVIKGIWGGLWWKSFSYVWPKSTQYKECFRGPFRGWPFELSYPKLRYATEFDISGQAKCFTVWLRRKTLFVFCLQKTGNILQWILLIHACNTMWALPNGQTFHAKQISNFLQNMFHRLARALGLASSSLRNKVFLLTMVKHILTNQFSRPSTRPTCHVDQW